METQMHQKHLQFHQSHTNPQAVTPGALFQRRVRNRNRITLMKKKERRKGIETIYILIFMTEL